MCTRLSSLAFFCPLASIFHAHYCKSVLTLELSPPQSNDEARQQSREYEETKKQIEEDADREILDIKNKYERRLRDEKEANMRLKGETGIMKKKVSIQLDTGICICFTFDPQLYSGG